MALAKISITSLQTRQQWLGMVDIDSIALGRGIDVYVNDKEYGFNILKTDPIRGWLQPEDFSCIYVMDQHGKRFLIRTR